MVYYILVGIFSSNLLYHKKDCFPTLLRVVAVFFYCAFFYSALAIKILLVSYIVNNRLYERTSLREVGKLIKIA